MPEFPDSLKKYLPGPLFLALTIAWAVGGDQVKDWVKREITEPSAHIRIEDGKDHLHIVHIEIAPHSEKAFEEVQIEVDLKSKPDDIKGELLALGGAHAALESTTSNPLGNVFLFKNESGKVPPLTLRPREKVEIALHEAPLDAVQGVWLNAKDRAAIAASDLNQRWNIPESAWRAGLAILAICALYFLYSFLLRLLSRKARKQLGEDKEFLHKCWQGDTSSLAVFETELQPIIDDGTAKYLKAFSPAVRDPARMFVIRQAIFERAHTLPQFRRSLAGEVQRFTITFCVDMLKLEYKSVKRTADKERAEIH
jgi:hypothetical protein